MIIFYEHVTILKECSDETLATR